MPRSDSHPCRRKNPRRIWIAVAAGLIASASVATPALAADRIENLVTTRTRIDKPGVKVQGGLGAAAVLSKSRTESRQLSGSIGISVSVVQVTLGYSYSESETVTYSYSIKAPDRNFCYSAIPTETWRKDSFKWIKDRSWALDISGRATTQSLVQISYNNDISPRGKGRC